MEYSVLIENRHHVATYIVETSNNRGEWPSGLRSWNRIGRIPIKTQLGTQSDSGTQPNYKAPDDLRVKSVKKQQLTLAERGFALGNGSK